MDTPTAPTAPRRRDAAATRAALLAAARELMAKHGVEGTSTRDVAAAAGVNQALVYRYFGSKEKLFAEVVKGGAEGSESEIATTPLPDLPHVLLTRALEHVAAPGTGSLSALVTAANDDTVRAHIRERIENSFGAKLAPRLEGQDVELRAELLAALITGIGFLRGKIGTPAISAADQELLGHYVDLMCAPLLAAPGDADGSEFGSPSGNTGPDSP
ncbi:TetR/AcrR family transcriptional regulator [Umezawaea sp. Da 62-37]|uniref:TetR/AcrR family transcriptional regulator n=1 Tax=Umezawaea sp. Da 62-37 TaxID=3075927 RepID=UPI0028F6CD07|nr:TetR/AcrR family transcriptional regulator [Umezawaea sp. Da 62-37]WNV86300.1 TetR/AcrR family transcriptional regulator [Umezawaea sp. Da 62-37]